MAAEESGKITTFVNPKYAIKTPSYVDTSTRGLRKTFNKPIDFQVPAAWGSQQQVTFNIQSKGLDMDYAEAELNMNLQISSAVGSMVAFPAGTPIAFAPDLAATFVDSFNWGLSTGGTIENPPGGQTDGIFIGDVIEMSNDWLIGQQGLQDAMILDDSGETQDTTGQPFMTSNQVVPAAILITDATQAALATPVPNTMVFTIGTGGALLNVKFPTNSIGQTGTGSATPIATTADNITIFIQNGATQLPVVAAGTTSAQYATSFRLGAFDATNKSYPLFLIGASAWGTGSTHETITFYAQSATEGLIPLVFQDISTSPPTQFTLTSTTTETNLYTSLITTASTVGSLTAQDLVLVTGVNQVIKQNTSRGFWARQALTDAGLIWTASIKIKRIISFLRSYRKVINSGNFFLQLTTTGNSVNNMIQKASWVPSGTVWVSDMQLTLTQLQPSTAAERKLDLKIGETTDFTWIRRRTIKIAPVQINNQSYEVSFVMISEFVEFLIFTFKPTTYFGNQNSNFNASLVPAAGSSLPQNPINQAFLQINAGEQVPASSYGQFPSDLAKQFAEVMELEHRKDDELLSGPLNINNYLKNYFFFVFNLSNREQVADFSGNQQGQIQTQFNFQTAFPAQYDVRVTTFSRANGRWTMTDGGLIYTSRGFKEVQSG
jgi:hypothetical protein